MKMNINSTGTQLIFQTLRALGSIGLIGGVAILFIQNGTGVFVQSLDNLAVAAELLTNFAG